MAADVKKPSIGSLVQHHLAGYRYMAVIAVFVRCTGSGSKLAIELSPISGMPPRGNARPIAWWDDAPLEECLRLLILRHAGDLSVAQRLCVDAKGELMPQDR